MSEAQQQTSGQASDAERRAALAAAILKASQPPATTAAPIPSDYVDAPYRPPVYTPPPIYIPPSTTPTGREIDYGTVVTTPTPTTTPTGREIDYGEVVTPPPTNITDYVDSPDREYNAQGLITDNPIVQVNEAIADVGTQKVIITQAESNLENYITQAQVVTETLNTQIAEMEDVIENADEYNWKPGQLASYEAALAEKRDALAELAATAPVDIMKTTLSIKAAKENLKYLEAVANLVKGRVNKALAKDLRALGKDVEELAPPDEIDVYVGRQENLKWRVVAANGEVREFSDYMEAVRFATDTWMPVGDVNLNVNTPAPFVDAAGMENYVAGLNIPTTQSGINQQGWVDARIEDASISIRDYGHDLESRAQALKMGGSGGWAGVYASGAVGAGVASALFDATTWLANPFPRQQYNVITDFSDNPMFATGVVGGNVALALYGAGSTYKYLKAKGKWLTPATGGTAQDTINPLGSNTALKLGDDVPRPSYLSGEGMNVPGKYEKMPYDDVDVAISWPEGSPEYNTAKLMKGDTRAFAMVDYAPEVITRQDELYRAAGNPYLSLDSPLYYYAYHTGRGAVAVAPPILAGLGSLSATGSLLRHNQAVIDSLSVKIPTITTVLTKNSLIPVSLPDRIAKTIIHTEAIQVPPVATDTILTPEAKPIEITISSTAVKPVIEPLIEPISDPKNDEPTYPPTDIKDIPEPTPPSEDPLTKIHKKEKESKRHLYDSDNLRSVYFTVRQRYGRKTVSRRVEAQTFREALVKALRGSPAEVEVRRTT